MINHHAFFWTNSSTWYSTLCGVDVLVESVSSHHRKYFYSGLKSNRPFQIELASWATAYCTSSSERGPDSVGECTDSMDNMLNSTSSQSFSNHAGRFFWISRVALRNFDGITISYLSYFSVVVLEIEFLPLYYWKSERLSTDPFSRLELAESSIGSIFWLKKIFSFLWTSKKISKPCTTHPEIHLLYSVQFTTQHTFFEKGEIKKNK